MLTLVANLKWALIGVSIFGLNTDQMPELSEGMQNAMTTLEQNPEAIGPAAQRPRRRHPISRPMPSISPSRSSSRPRAPNRRASQRFVSRCCVERGARYRVVPCARAANRTS